MSVTPNMGLYAWDQGEDFYSHTQLAGNFYALDAHDHTPGKGPRITTPALQDGAVTSPKIADGGVTTPKVLDGNITSGKLADLGVITSKIADLAVTTPKIADKSVTAAKLADDIVPLGTIIAWWRPSIATPIPSGWDIADGSQRTANHADPNLRHSFAGGGTITLPNLTNRFLLGAALGGTGTDPSQPPAIGQSGGNNNANLSHSHTVLSHRHTVDAHDHTVDAHSHVVNSHRHQVGAHSHQVNAHSHTVGAHTHPVSAHNHEMTHTHTTEPHSHTIFNAGDHTHLIAGGHSLRQRPYDPSESADARRQALYASGYNAGETDASAPIDNAGVHTHPISNSAPSTNGMSATHTGPATATATGNSAFATGTATPDTTSAAPFTTYETPGTNEVSPGTSEESPLTSFETPGTTSALASADIRPNYVGVLYLIKTRHS